MDEPPRYTLSNVKFWTTASIHMFCVVLMLLVFGVDLQIPLGITVGTLYIVAVLLAFWSSPRFIVGVAAVCSLLLMLALLLKLGVEDLWKAGFNRGLSMVTIWVTAALGLKIKAAEEELIKIASLDFLTGIFNRREVFKRLYTEASRVDRVRRPLSVIMIDIDHFKIINDRYGHGTGDKVLKETARLLKENLREYDTVCRYGGEEFLVLTPETPLPVAHELAERLRRIVMEVRLNIPSVPAIHFTISAGVTSFVNGEKIDSLLARVDTALYDAKQAGRNCVMVLAPQPS